MLSKEVVSNTKRLLKYMYLSMHNACIPTTIFALANDGKAFVGGISSILVISTSNCSIGFGKFEQIVGDLDPARCRTGHIPR